MENKSIITKYAIVTAPIVELRMYISDNLPRDDINPHSNKQSIPVTEGTLVKVFKTSDRHQNDKFSTVQVLDYEHNDFIYENLYMCPEECLLKVSEDIWPYVISIRNPNHRLRLLRSREECRWITYLKLRDMICVKGELFGKKAIQYDCIIRYIGPVQELRPTGYVFGLELLHLENGHSPQKDDIPFAHKYTACDAELSILTTADWIAPISSDKKSKFSAKQLINDTIEKVRTVIAPTTNFVPLPNNSNMNQIQRKDKKPKPKQPTAQFYDQYSVEDNCTLVEMERKPQFKKTVADIPVKTTDNEDFKQKFENYEKSLERQHATTKASSTTTTARTNSTGILKHDRTIDHPPTKDFNLSKKKSIKNLDGRDIIIIDDADIRDATKHEGNVKVVEKSHNNDIDLVELLGNNWPNSAGDAATILNRKTLDSEQNVDISNSKMERNKSASFLSHISTQHEVNKISHVNSVTNKENYCEDGRDVNTATELDIDENFVEQSPLQEVPHSGLGVGSMVEISVEEALEVLYGVIRWIGVPPGSNGVVVGVELEDEQFNKNFQATNGSYNGIRLFKCHDGRAVFVDPSQCANDKRFIETEGAGVGGANKSTNSVQSDVRMFGQVECPPVAGAVPPLKISNIEELEDKCGKFKGIQGHHNSCYLDATLFAMFTFTSVFDSLLYRPPEPGDISNYTEVQKVLREEIVNPLRKNVFVRADRVMKLRKLLDKLSSVSGLMTEEKDPEEFLNSLLAQIMRVEPFLKLNSGQDSYFYQLFVEKDDRLTFPTVQQLFEQSFHSSDIKLKVVPSCLIIQMPRFGKNFKMYPRILPSQVLDVTDIIEDSPRQCTVCGKLAEFECRDCFGNLQGGTGLECTAFCEKCLKTVHMHLKRANHTWKSLCISQDLRERADYMTVPRLYMELFAVVCIETSHYVAFVKAGLGPDAPWCFFDSMADRKGEKNGYNIPELITVPELPLWLSEDGARAVNETSTNDKILPEHAKRLFCDAYMCMYQSTDVMMYR